MCNPAHSLSRILLAFFSCHSDRSFFPAEAVGLLKERLSDEGVRAVMKGEARIYLWGELIYVDIFEAAPHALLVAT